jgi:hypothetical protein
VTINSGEGRGFLDVDGNKTVKVPEFALSRDEHEEMLCIFSSNKGEGSAKG